MADQEKKQQKKNAHWPKANHSPPTTTTGTTTNTTFRSLTEPSDMTPTEYQDLLQQIETDLTLQECQDELLDAARYDDIDVVRALLLFAYRNNSSSSSSSNKEDPKQTFSSSLSSFVNYQDATTGNTALHMAAANGHVRVVELLLQAAASAGGGDGGSGDGAHNNNIIAITNQAGNTPLHWAAANGQEAVVKLLLAQEQQQQQVVDVLQRNAFGRSALTEGFSSENTAIIKALLEHESATEERLLMQQVDASPTASDDANANVDKKNTKANIQQEQSITHALVFGRHTKHPTQVQIRELAMATDQNDAILGQDDPNDDTTGLGIWAASLVCAQWMQRMVVLSSLSSFEQQQQLEHSVFLPFVNNQEEQVTILELGSGCGVPGLVVASAVAASASTNDDDNNSHPTKIYLTDFNPRTIENLQYNIALNQNNRTATATVSTNNKESTQVLAQNINWQDATTWPKEKVDVMIGSDLIYQSDMVPALVNVVKGLLAHPHGVFFYVAPDTGRKGQDDFFAKMQEHDFVLISERTAPVEYVENPLQSQDEEECFLHFHELMNMTAANFKLYEFRWNKSVIG